MSIMVPVKYAVVAPDTDESLHLATQQMTVDVDCCNPNSDPALIRLAIVTGDVGDLVAADHVFYDYEIPAAGVGDDNSQPLLFRHALAAGEHLVVRSNKAGVIFHVTGKEG